MTQNNFCLLLLITIVVFFLFMMNSKSVEPYANAENTAQKTEIMKILEGKTNNVKSNQLIDNVVTRMANNANAGTNVEKSINVKTIQMEDIFKEDINLENQLKKPSNNVPSANSIGEYSSLDTSYAEINLNNLPKGTITSSELLPTDEKQNEYNQTKLNTSYYDANLAVDASAKLGVDTVGSSKKNASYDLRGTLPCPKFVVSPWMNSTYEPDTNIKSLY